jgi:hypothetical protein
VTLVGAYDWDLYLDGTDPSGRSEISGFETGTGAGAGDLAPFACPQTGFPYDLTFRLDLHHPETYAVVMTYTINAKWSVTRAATATTAGLSRSAVPTGEIVAIRGKVTATEGPYAGRPAGADTVKLQRRYKGSTAWKTFWTTATDATDVTSRESGQPRDEASTCGCASRATSSTALAIPARLVGVT